MEARASIEKNRAFSVFVGFTESNCRGYDLSKLRYDDQNTTAETAELSEIDQNGHTETPPQTQEIIELLKSQLEDTKTELVDAKSREKQLLSILSTEQEKTKLLMLAAPPAEPDPVGKNKPSILGYFRLKR